MDGDKDDEVILRSLKDVVFVPHERSLPTVGYRELDTLIIGGLMAKGGLTKIVSCVISSMVILLGKDLEEIAGVKRLSGAVQNLISALGPPFPMDEKFEAPTLLGTTSFIGEEVSQVVSLSQILRWRKMTL